MCTLPGCSGTHDDGHSRVYRSCTGCVMIEKVQLLVQRQSPRSLLTLTCNFLLSYPSRLYPIRVSFNGTVPPLDSTFLLIITFVTLLSKSGYDWTLLFLFLSVCSILPPGSYRAPGVYTNSSARAALAARAPGPATSAGPVPPESVSLPADPLSCTFATPVTLPLGGTPRTFGIRHSRARAARHSALRPSLPAGFRHSDAACPSLGSQLQRTMYRA